MPRAQLGAMLWSLAAKQADAARTDGALLRAFVAGEDQAAFTALVRRHGPAVLAVCRRVLRHLPDAEDAFQAAFLLLARNAASLCGRESLAGWLHGVAYRMAGHARRAASRRQRHERRAPVMQAASPEGGVMGREVQAVLDEEVERLPAIYRDVFVHRCLENHSGPETARALGVAEGTVRSRLSKARALLRQALTRRGLSVPAVLAAAALTANRTAAAIPESLMTSTVKAAALVAVGQPLAAGTVPANVITLLRGATTMTALGKLKAVLLVLILALAGTGFGAAAGTFAGPELAADGLGPAAAQPPAPGRPLVDPFGDPLPGGALARLGSGRLHHKAGVSSLSFAPDGRTLATAAVMEDAVCLWDPADGKALGRLKVGGLLCTAAFSPDGQSLAVGVLSGGAGRVEIWEARVGGRLLQSFDAREKFWLKDVVFSPDGRVLATTRAEPRGKATIRLWHVATGKALHELDEHTGAVMALAFSPDGKTLASAGADDRVVLWDVRTGDKIRSSKANSGILWSVAFTPDGKSLLWSGNAGVRLWAADTGKQIRLFETSFGGTTHMALSPDGKTVAANTTRLDGDKWFYCLRLWDVGTGKELRPFDKPREELGRLAFSPDGKRLASTGNGGNTAVRLYDVSTGKPVPEIGAAGRRFESVAFSPDGKVIAARSCLWDAATGRLLHDFKGADDSANDCCAFSPDGKRLATTSLGSEAGVHLWDVAARKHAGAFAGGAGWATTRVFYSADGLRLVTASEASPSPARPPAPLAVQVWDVARRQQVSRFETARDWPGALAASADGKGVAVGGYLDGSVGIWDAAGGKEIRRLRGHAKIVNAIAYSADGGTLATGSTEAVCLWQVDSGKLLRRLDTGGRRDVGALAFSPDGRTIAGAGSDSSVRLWEAATGGVRFVFEGHQGRVLSLSFAADGRRLVSGSDDGTALVWDVSGAGQAGRAGPRRWSPEESDAVWADLADTDARKAYRAVWDLAEAPAQAARLLGQRLRPVPALDEARREHIGQLVANLDADTFAAREEATRALAEIGEPAEQILRDKLAAGPSAEARRRLEGVLEKLGERSGESVRASRALEALEYTGGPEARKVLEALARGDPGAWLTRQAKAARERSSRRSEGR